MVALSVLVSGLDAEMARLGYKDSTMVWYRSRALAQFVSHSPPSGAVHQWP
jgi:hypothetical protein